MQRVPPTERKGRVHTSTITVAVLTEQKVNVSYTDSDFTVQWFSGTGSGGQHRNKTQNCCRIIHTPTGITQSVQGRKRNTNYIQAKEAVIKILEKQSYTEMNTNINSLRQTMVGSGMRGDKRRTYRFQDDIVLDHMTGKTSSCKKIMKGLFDKLWN